MKKAILVADSGGTETNWCLVDSLGNRNYFTTESYHPHLINEDWIRSKKHFWADYINVYSITLFFYGAGCSKKPNQEKLKAAFHSWGFETIHVQSDIIAAAHACFGSSDGIIGILGTGSVIAEIENNEIKMIHGGFGYLLGDEGSGYYFGKILLKKYLLDHLSVELKEHLENTFGSRETILNNVYSLNGKKFIGSLSKSISEFTDSAVRQLHKENIDLFLELYLPESHLQKEISFIGSYAFHNKAILEESLSKMNWKLNIVIEKPIEALTEYLLKATF